MRKEEASSQPKRMPPWKRTLKIEVNRPDTRPLVNLKYTKPVVIETPGYEEASPGNIYSTCPEFLVTTRLRGLRGGGKSIDALATEKPTHPNVSTHLQRKSQESLSPAHKLRDPKIQEKELI